LFSQSSNRFLQKAVLQERLTLASLAEADDRGFALFHMGQSDLNDFSYRWDKGNPQVRGLATR
jgi:hypothetical protein